MRRIVLSFVLLAFGAGAQTLKVVGFNVESGGAQLSVLAQAIAGQQGVDLWGLSEVQDQSWLTTFQQAAADGEGATFEGILGTTGDADRLAIVYNATRFELVRFSELHHINIAGRVRAPLVAQLRVRAQPQVEFFFMVNHLYRGNEEGRHQQAKLLNEWAKQQTLPVIATGDFNFDWSVTGGDTNHDKGYDFMIAGDTFRWIRYPDPLVKTQCSGHNSVLDFVFVSGVAKSWQSQASILFADDAGYCSISRNGSDHRPVMATLTVAGGPPPPPPSLRTELLSKIAVLEKQLSDLKETVERLPQ